MLSRRSYLEHAVRPCAVTIAICTALQTVSLQTAWAADLPSTRIVPSYSASSLFSGVEYHVQGEAGILGNSLNPTQGSNGEGYNFGQLYEDHANEPQLNQLLLTITKPVDAAATSYAFGFTLQGLYGSDMRFNHFLGIGDQFLGSQRNQLNIAQGFVAAHLPIFTSGGVDLKVGLFQSPQGYENLDASANPPVFTQLHLL